MSPIGFSTYPQFHLTNTIFQKLTEKRCQMP